MLSRFFRLSEGDKIKIKVKLSAYYREIVGKKELNIELKETMTVNELMKMLIAEYPKLGEFTDYTMILLNCVYAEGTELVEDGDEVALFPPLDGG